MKRSLSWIAALTVLVLFVFIMIINFIVNKFVESKIGG